MFAHKYLAAVAATLFYFQEVSGLGINCRGSGLCPLAGFENAGSEGVLQGLRDAMYSVNNSTVPDNTVYNNGDHVICVSTSVKISISAGVSKDGASGTLGLSGAIGIGGVCVFAQNTASGITLAQARTLMDGLLEHGCKVCGSNPSQPGNNDATGELTVNYVSNPDCVGNCLSAGGALNPAAGKDETTATSGVVSSSHTVGATPVPIYGSSSSAAIAPVSTKEAPAYGSSSTEVSVRTDSAPVNGSTFTTKQAETLSAAAPLSYTSPRSHKKRAQQFKA